MGNEYGVSKIMPGVYTLSTVVGVIPDEIRSLGISSEGYDGETDIDAVRLNYAEGHLANVVLMNQELFAERGSGQLHIDHSRSQKADYLLTVEEDVAKVTRYLKKSIDDFMDRISQ